LPGAVLDVLIDEAHRRAELTLSSMLERAAEGDEDSELLPYAELRKMSPKAFKAVYILGFMDGFAHQFRQQQLVLAMARALLGEEEASPAEEEDLDEFEDLESLCDLDLADLDDEDEELDADPAAPVELSDLSDAEIRRLLNGTEDLPLE